MKVLLLSLVLIGVSCDNDMTHNDHYHHYDHDHGYTKAVVVDQVSLNYI